MLFAPQRTNPFVDVPPLAALAARFAVFAFLVAVCVAAMFSDTAAHITALRLLALFVFITVSCAPLIFRIRGIGLFHPLFFLSAYGFIKGTLPSARPIAMGVESHVALPFMGPGDVGMLQVKVMLLGALSWLMMIVGYFATSGISWRFITFRNRPSAIIWGATAAYVAGIFGFYSLVKLSGGFWEHAKNITRGFAAKVWVADPELASTYAFLVNLSTVLPAYLLLRYRHATKMPGFWISAVGACVLLFMVNGRRSALLQPVLLFICCWILQRRQVALGRIGLVAVVLFLSAGVIGEYRRSNWSSAGGVTFDFMSDVSVESALQMSLQEFEQRSAEGGPMYPILARVPGEVPHLYGANYLAYVNRFIPRIIWEDKPRGIGVDCGRIFYGVGHGVPPGALGEAYWSGGVIGVVVVFFLWGAILKSAAKFFIRFRGSAVACMLYLMTLAVLSPSEPSFRAWLYIIVPSVAILVSVGVLKIATSGKQGASQA